MAGATPKFKRSKSDQCKVCGDLAGYSYFGAVVCEPCKMFFKRYAENRKKTWRCKSNDECEINVLTRHACTACRLKKCFQSGMQAEKIRHTNRTNTTREYHTTMTYGLIPRNNLLQKDTSRLTRDQWTLFGNIINNFDLSDPLRLAERLNNEGNRLEIKSLQRIDTVLAQEFFGSLYKEAGRACRNNVDLQNLPNVDRSVLLYTAAENVVCLAGSYVFAEGRLSNHGRLMTYLDNIYGLVPMQHHRWATTFAQRDMVLFKLALALFSLLPTSRVLRPTATAEYSDVKTIAQLEHKYAALTWEYLLYKYSFNEAVQRYFSLIRWFLAMNVFIHHAQSAQTHLNDVESLIEETELNLIMDDVNKIVADGK